MMLQVVLDGGFEFDDALEDTAADTIGGNPAEEALDLVDPGTRCGGEVHVEAAVVGQAGFGRGVVLGGGVFGGPGRVGGVGGGWGVGWHAGPPWLWGEGASLRPRP